MTNPSKKSKASRAERKAQDREHLKIAPREAKIIKLADRIDNLTEIGAFPRDFQKLYVAESKLLLVALADTDDILVPVLRSQINMLGG